MSKKVSRSSKDLAKLVSFLADSGLEEDLSRIRARYLHQRGYITEPPHLSRSQARFTFSIQHFDGKFERKFSIICLVNLSGEVEITINSTLHYTEETLPRQPQLYQFLMDQINDPTVRQLK